MKSFTYLIVTYNEWYAAKITHTVRIFLYCDTRLLYMIVMVFDNGNIIVNNGSIVGDVNGLRNFLPATAMNIATIKNII